MEMKQVAPWPEKLVAMVQRLEYRPGWSFRVVDLDRGQGSRGLTLVITVETVNSYLPHEPLRVAHYLPIPPAAYDDRSWQRWLFDQCVLLDRHEACEFFTVDGAKPYAPSHGPGNDPYLVREIGTETDQRTSFRGEVN